MNHLSNVSLTNVLDGIEGQTQLPIHAQLFGLHIGCGRVIGEFESITKFGAVHRVLQISQFMNQSVASYLSTHRSEPVSNR